MQFALSRQLFRQVLSQIKKTQGCIKNYNNYKKDYNSTVYSDGLLYFPGGWGGDYCAETCYPHPRYMK